MANRERCGGLCVLPKGHHCGCYAPVYVRDAIDAEAEFETLISLVANGGGDSRPEYVVAEFERNQMHSPTGDDAQPMTCEELDRLEAEYVSTFTLKGNARRKARRDVADNAFYRLLATARAGLEWREGAKEVLQVCGVGPRGPWYLTTEPIDATVMPSVEDLIATLALATTARKQFGGVEAPRSGLRDKSDG